MYTKQEISKMLSDKTKLELARQFLLERAVEAAMDDPRELVSDILENGGSHYYGYKNAKKAWLVAEIYDFFDTKKEVDEIFKEAK